MLKKTGLITLSIVPLLLLAACSDGETAAENARSCISGRVVDGGATYTNNCDFNVNVAIFDPIARFLLSPGQTRVVNNRTTNLEFAACQAPSKPKEVDDKFFCD